MFCGIPALALAVPEPAEPEPADGAEGDGALADGERALGEEADPEEAGPEEAEGDDAAGEGLLDPPPQPAAASASAASAATHAAIERDFRMSLSYLASDISARVADLIARRGWELCGLRPKAWVRFNCSRSRRVGGVG